VRLPVASPLVNSSSDALAVLAGLMGASHNLGGDDLPHAVSAVAKRLGAVDAVVYVADLQQQVLVPHTDVRSSDSNHQATPLAISSTVAGRVFQHLEPVVREEGGDRSWVWIPLLNGTERLGVLLLELDAEGFANAVTPVDGADHDPEDPVGSSRVTVATHWTFFADLVAELVMTKTLYGDSLVRLRRTAPMGLAAEIQWDLLPPLTFNDGRVSLAAALEPAYEVAGDSVDYAVDHDKARFAVFDGMGHELRSAQLVGLVVAAYRNARRSGLTLVETCEHVEHAVLTAFGDEGFVTGLLAELDVATGTLSWVSAGHPPPLLLRHGRHVKTLELQPRLPFGMAVPGAPTTVVVGTEHLEPGDRVLLYTDGVTEGRSAEGEQFGADRLTDLVVRNLAAGMANSETMRRAVVALLEHQGDKLADDATMLLAQWRP
jgi:hypothetical protein